MSSSHKKIYSLPEMQIAIKKETVESDAMACKTRQNSQEAKRLLHAFGEDDICLVVFDLNILWLGMTQ